MTPAHGVTGERLLERILHLSFSEHLFFLGGKPQDHSYYLFTPSCIVHLPTYIK